MKFDWKHEWLPITAILTSLIVSAVLYPNLPDPMPIHWGAGGQPDNFGSRLTGAFMAPLLSGGVYLLMLVLPRIDPRQNNIRRFGDTYRLIRSGTVIFLVFVHFLSLNAVMRAGMTLNTTLMIAAVGLFLALIGNYLPRTRSNWFLGVRTPWTLSSERVWKKTHRLAGRLFVTGGILLAVAGFFLPGSVVWMILGLVVVLALVPVAYSYFLFREETNSTQGE